MRYASFGSVSHGTMRTEDLLSTFASELEYQMKRQAQRFPRKAYRKLVNEARRKLVNEARRKLVNEARREMGEPNDHNMDGQDVVNELFDALGEFAPPYAYFGAHEGDGSDYGYWLSLAAEDFDGLKVDDTSEVPADYRGEVLHVNDHGNMTLYVSNGRGKLKEIWAVV